MIAALITQLLSEYWTWIAGGIGIVAVALGIRWDAKKDARAEIESMRQSQAIEAMKKSQEVRNEVSRLPSGAAESKLRSDWMRKRPERP